MESWTPITLDELQRLVEDGVSKMPDDQLQFWSVIAIDPEKWIEKNNGQEGDGFWVVAVWGNSVVWYNDIEEGFNVSKFSEYGQIDEYKAGQDELQWTISKLKPS